MIIKVNFWQRSGKEKLFSFGSPACPIKRWDLELACSDQITCKPCLQFLTLVRNNVVVWWNKCTTWTVQAELESTVSACGEAKTKIKQKERKVGVMRMPTDALTSVIKPFTHGLGHIKGQPLALRLCPDHPAVDVPLRRGGKIFVS